MATKVEKTIEVNVPVSTAYNQWTQFEDFPQFMGGISEVRQLNDTTLHWVAEIAGVKRQWEATILEQVPDRKVAWAATEGATNAGAVFFEPAGPDRTSVTLSLEYEPEGIVEQAADRLNVVERRVQADLEKFKQFIESEGYASGAWRGAVNEGGGVGAPGVEAAAASEGTSGGAGVSKKAIAGTAAAAAAGIAAAAALKGRSGGDEGTEETTVETVETVEVTPVDVTPLDASPALTDPTLADDLGTTGTAGSYAADDLIVSDPTLDTTDEGRGTV